MANNRLYLVDTETGEKCLLAKAWSGWELQDFDQIQKWIQNRDLGASCSSAGITDTVLKLETE